MTILISANAALSSYDISLLFRASVDSFFYSTITWFLHKHSSYCLSWFIELTLAIHQNVVQILTGDPSAPMLATVLSSGRDADGDHNIYDNGVNV